MRNPVENYVWLVDTIRTSNGITLNELREEWRNSNSNDGKTDLPRSTFMDWKREAEEFLGISIDFRRVGKRNEYFISEDSVVNSNIPDWVLRSLRISMQISDAKKMHERIQMEEVPSGDKYLMPLISAMKKNRIINLEYKKFIDTAPETWPVKPYCVKMFEKRWYVIGYNIVKRALRTYALDRIQSLEITKERFRMPETFSIQKHFEHSYGIYGGKEFKPEEIRLRAFGTMRNYLRTLPIHSSQQEVLDNDTYSEFTYTMAITLDLKQYFLSQGDWIEILEPQSLREDIKDRLQKAINRYSSHS